MSISARTCDAPEMSFQYVEGWGALPPDHRFLEAAGVAVDSKDNVFVFCRGEKPVIVFNRAGEFLRSWGVGLFSQPHAITIGPDDEVWLTDAGNHTIRKFTADGRLLLTIGDKDKPATLQGGRPFNRPTHVALCPFLGRDLSRTATATRASTSTIPRGSTCSPGAKVARRPVRSTSRTT